MPVRTSTAVTLGLILLAAVGVGAVFGNTILAVVAPAAAPGPTTPAPAPSPGPANPAHGAVPEPTGRPTGQPTSPGGAKDGSS